MILISKVRMSVSKKINLMVLIRTLTISTTTFERMKEKFDGFRQTVKSINVDLKNFPNCKVFFCHEYENRSINLCDLEITVQKCTLTIQLT